MTGNNPTLGFTQNMVNIQVKGNTLRNFLLLLLLIAGGVTSGAWAVA